MDTYYHKIDHTILSNVSIPNQEILLKFAERTNVVQIYVIFMISLKLIALLSWI